MYITITSHVFSYWQINLQTFITSSILTCPCFISEYITFIWLPTNLTSNFHRFQHTHLYTYLGSSSFWVHDKYIADNKSTFKLLSLPAYLARVPASRPYYVRICLCVYLPACVCVMVTGLPTCLHMCLHICVMSTGLLHQRPVPGAGERGIPVVLGAQWELHLLWGGRPLPGHDPARVQGGGKETEEALCRLQLRWLLGRA